MEPIISEIKKKKELSDLPNDLVKEELDKILKKYNFKLTDNKKTNKTIIKLVRAELRKYSGRYEISSKKRDSLMDENNWEELLKKHSSTKERINSYPEIKELIFKNKPKSILDLGCGINPIAIANKNTKYYAYDIKEKELNLLKEFFKKENILGEVFFVDIRKVKEYPKTDICLIFKVLDLVDSKRHENAKIIFEKVKSKEIIISFSTRTLSGKKMSVPRRPWFEKYLEKNNISFEVYQTINEIFYIIRRKPLHQ